MFTINYMWVSNIQENIPEAKSELKGLYPTIEEARVGLNNWLMKMPNNNCEIKKCNDEKYTFLSPNGKTRGFIEIQEIQEIQR